MVGKEQYKVGHENNYEFPVPRKVKDSYMYDLKVFCTTSTISPKDITVLRKKRWARLDTQDFET